MKKNKRKKGQKKTKAPKQTKKNLAAMPRPVKISLFEILLSF